ncbi:MAG TPA: ParB/RepB/Spo0J family partition protein [Bacillota bacterium]|jgi:ParB/RepB/Spo0J family partition protein
MMPEEDKPRAADPLEVFRALKDKPAPVDPFVMPEVPTARSVIRLDEIEVVSNVRKSFDPEKMAELEASIRAHGVLQPILVAARDDGRYRLVAGERRLRAARAAGLEGVPAMVAEMTEAEVVECQVVENLQREDVSAIEEAEGFRQLVEVCKMTQQQVAKRIGISQSQVANRLRLLRLPKDVQDKIIARQITAGHGMALLKLLPERGKPGPLFDEAVKKMAGGEVSVAGAQQVVDNIIWHQGQSLARVKPGDVSLGWKPYEACFDAGAECLRNPKSGRCPYVVEAGRPWDTRPKAELRCINPECWKRKQDAAYKPLAEAAKAKEEEQKKAEAKKAREDKPKVNTERPPKNVPPAPPIENIDVRLAQRLGKAAWAAEDDLAKWGDFEFRRECYLPLHDLLKHFEERSKLGASNMPATMEHVYVELVGEGVTFSSCSGRSAEFELDPMFEFKAGSVNLESLTVSDVPPVAPVYYCAEIHRGATGSGSLIQRVAMALGKSRVLVVVASDAVMMRRELRPRWYDLLNSLPASPVSCVPNEDKKANDDDVEACRADSDPEGLASDQAKEPPGQVNREGLGCETCPTRPLCNSAESVRLCREAKAEAHESHADLIARAAVNGCGDPRRECKTCAVRSTCNSYQAEGPAAAVTERPQKIECDTCDRDDCDHCPNDVEPAAQEAAVDGQADDEDKPLKCSDCGIRNDCRRNPEYKRQCRGEAAG